MDKEQVKDQTVEVVSDKLGIYLSALCCLHCLATPFLIIFAPAISKYFENELVHLFSIILIVPIGLYAFISKLKVHDDKRPLYVGILGMVLLAASTLFHGVHGGHGLHEHHNHHMGHEFEVIFTVVGGIALVWAHLKNIKLCSCKSCEH